MDALPQPQPASFDAHLAALDEHPLFMRALPPDADDNPALSALQSLVHDGTPDEIAQSFKEQGNEYFRGRRFREAAGFYAQGVQARPDDAALREALLLNRAACNLELQNYGAVLRDCADAIAANPAAAKAYYRAASALLALDRADEARDACARGAAVAAPGDAGFAALAEKIDARGAVLARRRREREDRAAREAAEKRRMDAAFAERGLVAVANPEGSANPYAPALGADGVLALPVFFLYPEHATSDAVPALREDVPLGAQLATMFPPDAPPPAWDAAGRYVARALVVYAITRRRRLLKVGRAMALADLWRAVRGKGDGDGVEVKDGCVTLVVLPKGEAEQKWVQEYKSERDK
ncbi:hypothetical protein BC834DRAFT_1044554 [Gloeopeniophorella convolvens]|nr:hypothetical protein BC834DRAFT_1044554 [Gloeopeniophorella convolvens]